MAHDSHHTPANPRPTTPPRDPLPLALWLIWTLSVVATAIWVAWPALYGLATLDLPRLVIMSALTGAAGLLLLTVLEIHLAPWRFLD